MLEGRLRKRNSDSEAEIQKRLGVARREVAEWCHFDYLLVSTSVAEDVRRARVILEAEKMRGRRSAAPEF